MTMMVQAVAAGIGGADALGGASILVSLLQLLLLAGVYVWFALALTAVFRKLDQPAWKAWVPVVNMWTLFELGGMKGWWAVVQAVAGAIAVVVSVVVAAWAAALVLDAAFSGSTSAGGAAVAATLVPLVLWTAYLILILVLNVRMLSAVNRIFALGVPFTILGVLILPLWASIVGWGGARPGGAPAPGPFAAEPAPAASVAPAPAASFAPPTAAPLPPSAPVPPGAAPLPTPTAAGNPWMPPAPAASAPAPTVAASAPATPAPAAPVPQASTAVDEVEDHTVLAAHRRTSPTLTLPGGATVALLGDAAVLGRNPVAPADAPGAQRVPIDDVTRTVSKTHALLRRDGDRWFITDLASTNGVVVGDAEHETEVTSSTPLAGRFLLGDAELHFSAS